MGPIITSIASNSFGGVMGPISLPWLAGFGGVMGLGTGGMGVLGAVIVFSFHA